MQVVAIVTTIGLFLLKRKRTINLSFNLLYCWEAYINTAALVQLHYPLLCRCALKSSFQIHFLKMFIGRSFHLTCFLLICLGWKRSCSGERDSFYSHHSSSTPQPTPHPLPLLANRFGQTITLTKHTPLKPTLCFRPDESFCPALLNGFGFAFWYFYHVLLALLGQVVAVLPDWGLQELAHVKSTPFRVIRGKHRLSSGGVLLGAVSWVQAFNDRKTGDKSVLHLVCTPFIPEKHYVLVTPTLQL